MKKIIILVLLGLLIFSYPNEVYGLSDRSDDIAINYINKAIDGVIVKGNYNINSKEYIVDFANHKYILYELDPHGYIIIDNDSLVVIESSFEVNSPYNNYKDEEKLYLGPLNYYVLENDVVYNIVYDKEYKLSEKLTNLSNDFHSKIQTYHKNQMNEKESLSQTKSVTLPTGWTMIENYEYFENLTQFPNNYTGTCGFVALSMLLGYYDTFYNDNFIPNHNITVNGASQSLLVKGKATYTGSTSHIPISNWSVMPGTTQAMHDLLYNYGYYLWSTQSGSPVVTSQLVATLNDYVDDYASILENNINIEAHYTNINIHSSLRNSINNDKPSAVVIINGSYTNPVNYTSEVVNFHTVVVYGYNFNTNQYVAHFGWWPGSKQYTSIMINSIFAEGFMTVNYTGAHKHSKNVETIIHGQKRYVCGCGHVSISPC